jgi:hypothetical protein
MNSIGLLASIEVAALNQQLQCLERVKKYKSEMAYTMEMRDLKARISNLRAYGPGDSDSIRKKLVREGIVAPGGGCPKLGDTYKPWF